MFLNFIDWNTMRQTALVQLGQPYSFGTKPNYVPGSPGDNGMCGPTDCSGFVKWCFSRAGITIPDGSENQFEASVPVTIPQFGDVGFFKKPGALATDHVGLVLDANFMIEARGEPFDMVIKRPRLNWEKWPEFTGYRRFKAVLP